jgi:hypothetical protein
MAILTTASDFEQVRYAMEMLEATPDIIPDSVIQYDVFRGNAELEIKTHIPDAESKTGDDATRVKIATVCLTAAKMVPTFRRLKSEQYNDDSSFQYLQLSNETLITQLEDEAYRNIEEVIDPGTTVSDRATRRRSEPTLNRHWANQRGGAFRRGTEAGSYRRRLPR